MKTSEIPRPLRACPKRGTGTLHLASESGNRHDIREPVPVFGQTLIACAAIAMNLMMCSGLWATPTKSSDGSKMPAQADGSRRDSDNADTVRSKNEMAGETSLIKIEQNIVYHTNRQRARHGVPPVEVDQRLMRSARAHAAWMTRTRNLVHTTKMVAENIAMGQQSSREAVADWMTSPGHRANILDRRHRQIGVAAYRTSEGTIFWCQQFRH